MSAAHVLTNSRFGRAGIAVVAMLGLMLAGARSAAAITAPIQIANTSGEGVYLRAEPNTSSARLGWMPEGASPDYNCFAWGQSISGVPIWFSVNYGGVSGYYASYFDNSSYGSNAELTAKYGVPMCGSSPTTSEAASESGGSETAPSESVSESAPAGVSFNRSGTTSWGLSHARSTPLKPAACTWFVSQALWAGGLPKTTSWTSSGAHGHLWNRRPGTAAAWAAPTFIEYILRAYPRSTFTQIDFRANKVPAAEPGDVIAYDWDGQSSVHSLSHIKHVSLVTSIASGQYPDVSEWSIYDGRQPTPYASRGWTWSQKSRQWLQLEYPKVQAFLLHIDTGR